MYLSSFIFVLLVCGADASHRSSGERCQWNLTQPKYSPWSARPGAGWLMGDFTTIAALNETVASLLLYYNGSDAGGADLVTVNVMLGGTALATATVPRSASGARIPVDISKVPAGEYHVTIVPTDESAASGWCGMLRRFLRKEHSLYNHAKLQSSGTRARGDDNQKGAGTDAGTNTDSARDRDTDVKPLARVLRINQPVLFYDDYFVDRSRSPGQSQQGTLQRRVIPPEQIRIANNSWLTASGKRFPWQKVSRGLVYDSDKNRLNFGMAMNYGNSTAPNSDPTAEMYDCNLHLDVITAAADGNTTWECTRSTGQRMQASEWVNKRQGREQPSQQQQQQQLQQPQQQQQHQLQPQEQTPHSPVYLYPNWPLASTVVRHYDAMLDGAVNLTEIGVYFTYTAVTFEPHNVSLRAISGYPVWQHTNTTGTRLTILLPVDGVAGRPLLHCDSLSSATSNQQTLEQVCRDPTNCMCNGDNITDIGCANDNFGGSWMIRSASGEMTFAYAQGRRVSAFAPYSAGYDNLAEIRRVMVTWYTTDGLIWKQTFWGPPEDGDVPEQYGAVNMCASQSDMPERAISTACRDSNGNYDGSPILTFEMPFDVVDQVFWMDLRFSTDGLKFSKVKQDGPEEPAIAIPNRTPLGSPTAWNGGMLMGVYNPIVIGQYTYSLLGFVDNSPHFAFVFRTMTNLSTAAIVSKGKSEFFGALLPSEWPWFKKHGGWEGVAELARNVRIEVGMLRYRTEGLVCLRADVVPATVVTYPLRVDVQSCGSDGSNSSGSAGASANSSFVGTLNFKANGGSGSGFSSSPLKSSSNRPSNNPMDNDVSVSVSVELLDAAGVPLVGFSGENAATLAGNVDGVDLPLLFGGGRTTLPEEIILRGGVVVRITMHQANAELYGFSVRCG